MVKPIQSGPGVAKAIDLQAIVKKYGWIFLLLIPIVLSVYLRMMPAYLPVTDQWATSSVDNNARNKFAGEVAQSYPNLPPEILNEYTNRKLAEYMMTPEYRDEIQQTSEYLKTRFQDSEGQTYLIAIDPYMHYRHSLNLYNNGHVGDELKNGTVPWNTHMLAPEGRQMKLNLHHVVGVVTFNTLKIFNPGISYMGSFFYIPVLLTIIAIIPAFFIIRKFAGNIGAMVGSIFLAIHPAFLSRTAAGFSDTDVYNILFPLYVLWFFLLAIDSKDLKWKFTYIILAGLTTGLYSFAWTGWWYVFWFVIAGFVVYVVADSIKSDKPIVRLSISAGMFITYFFLTGMVVSVVKSFATFTNILMGPFRFISIQTAAHSSLWPNVYTTVAELNKSSLSSIINGIGGLTLFIISLVGLIWLLVKGPNKISRNVRYSFLALLLVWFGATMYASTNGVRFVMLLVPAFCIAIGIFVGITWQVLAKWFSKSMGIPYILAAAVLISASFLLPASMADDTLNIAKNEIPSMNDAWYDTLTNIKQKSAPDAIINSWWDFGHWFKAIADRAVTFDGASQNTPRAHWIGRVLLTDNELEAIAILRMLDCGGNVAFDIVDKTVADPTKSIKIIKNAIMMDSTAAEAYLQDIVSHEDASLIISKTHCEPPEDYFIVSQDMVGKSGVWAHFGSWDFDRSWMWANLRDVDETFAVTQLKDKFGLKGEDSKKLYDEIQSLSDGRDANNWIAPWPSYRSSASPCSDAGVSGQILLQCSNGVLINMTNTSQIQAGLIEGDKVYTPKRITFPSGTGYETTILEGGENNPYSVALLSDGSGVYSLLMDDPLLDSMFTKLFFFNGHGLENFEIFSYNRAVTGDSIYTYKVVWE